MSYKQEQDKKKPGWPWTARQKRIKESKRIERKRARKAGAR